MQHIDAVEQQFPHEIPQGICGVLSVRFPPEQSSVVSLNVRPGTDAVARRQVKMWAGAQLVSLALYPERSCGWEKLVDGEGEVVMQKYALVEYLPEP